MIGLNTTVDVYRLTTGTNDYGETTWSLSTGATYSDVPCRKISGPLNERDRVEIQLGSEVEVATHKWLFEASRDVVVFDRLKYGSDYHKVLAAANVDEMGHHLEVWTAKLEGVT